MASRTLKNTKTKAFSTSYAQCQATASCVNRQPHAALASHQCTTLQCRHHARRPHSQFSKPTRARRRANPRALANTQTQQCSRTEPIRARSFRTPPVLADTNPPCSQTREPTGTRSYLRLPVFAVGDARASGCIRVDSCLCTRTSCMRVFFLVACR